jgi:hypothetical protein
MGEYKRKEGIMIADGLPLVQKVECGDAHIASRDIAFLRIE